MNQEVSDQNSREEMSGQETSGDNKDIARPKSQLPNAIWLVAVLFAALGIAVGVSYYMNKLLDPVQDQAIRIDQAISATQEEVDDLEESLEDSREEMVEVSENLASADLRLRRELDEVQNEMNQLRAQLQVQHSQMLAMSGNQLAADSSWQKAEILYLLQIANERLTLAKDPVSALAALRLADQRIAALGDPGLTPVRAQVASEIQALEAVPATDVEGTVLKLSALSSTIHNLNIRGPGRMAESDEPETEEDSGFSAGRALDKIGESVSGMFKISKTDEESAALLSPDEQFFLRNNIRLQLDAARLAALSRDQTSYEQSLTQAQDWLGEYFVGSDTAVQSALSNIAELKNVTLSPTLPDISSSLTLMQAAAKLSTPSTQPPTQPSTQQGAQPQSATEPSPAE